MLRGNGTFYLFLPEILDFPSGRDTLIFQISSLVTYFSTCWDRESLKDIAP